MSGGNITPKDVCAAFFNVTTTTTAGNLQFLTATVITSLEAWKLQMDTRDCDSLSTTRGIKGFVSLLNLKKYVL